MHSKSWKIGLTSQLNCIFHEASRTKKIRTKLRKGSTIVTLHKKIIFVLIWSHETGTDHQRNLKFRSGFRTYKRRLMDITIAVLSLCISIMLMCCQYFKERNNKAKKEIFLSEKDRFQSNYVIKSIFNWFVVPNSSKLGALDHHS